MSQPYSEDFRMLVLRKYDKSGKKVEVCEEFKIGRNTLYKWLRLRKNGKSLQPQKRVNKPRKANYVKLRELVVNNANMTQKEIGNVMGMSQSGVHYAMKIIGITFKKKQSYKESNKEKQKES